jgi:hypothetical protein
MPPGADLLLPARLDLKGGTLGRSDWGYRA